MTATPSGGASARGAAQAALPRPSRTATIVPLGVLGLICGMIAWSAWPTLRPVRVVHVTQAIFQRAAPVAATGEGAQAEAAPRTGGVTVQAAGWLEAEPFFVACTALADGVVESMEVLEGDRVTAGQVVARLVAEDSELRLARASAEVGAAQAASALAEAELTAAQTDWDQPVERERAVETSRAALAEAEAELAQLPSLVRAAQATLIERQEELKKIKRSLEAEVATELEEAVAEQRVASQQANVEALRKREPLLAAKVRRHEAELRAAERNLELRIEERLRLAAAKADLARAKATLDRAMAARDEAALELERMVIRAPIDGYVQARLKVPGDKVIRMMDSPHSAHLLHLYDPERVQVRVDVPLADAAHVYVGQRCEVVVEVLPDQPFAGEVLRITHEADLQKNTLQVKVRVIDPSPLLRPEMLTRVKFLPGGDGAVEGSGPAPIPTAKEEAAPDVARTQVLAPTEAVQGTGEAARVWAIRERRGDRGVARAVPVRIVATSDGWLTIAGALNPGELLAVTEDALTDGERVRIVARGRTGS